MRTGQRRKTSSARGFTLLELMVSLAVGGIAISAIYAVGTASTRQFHQQQQIANAQTVVRVAINQLKRDIARAGFMHTPNAAMPGESCAAPTTTLSNPPTHTLGAIARFQNNVPLTAGNSNTNVDLTGNNAALGATVDDITLMANYQTASEYGRVRLANPGINDTIAVAGTLHSFQRDFHNWWDPQVNPNDADAQRAAFVPGRLIRIRTTTGLNHFAVLNASGVNVGTATTDLSLKFTPAVPANCQAAVNNGWVAPVSAIRYYVRNVPGGLEAQRNPGHGAIAQLVREEVQPGDKVTPLTGGTLSARVIADYVVSFNLAFTMTANTGLAAPDQYTLGSVPDVPNMTPNAAVAPNTTVDPAVVNVAPERVRAVYIDLGVRTPEQDPTWPWSAGNCANLRCYQVFSDRPGASRVRRMRAEVFLPNVAAGGF